jgi:hypothetical protein
MVLINVRRRGGAEPPLIISLFNFKTPPLNKSLIRHCVQHLLLSVSSRIRIYCYSGRKLFGNFFFAEIKKEMLKYTDSDDDISRICIVIYISRERLRFRFCKNHHRIRYI